MVDKIRLQVVLRNVNSYLEYDTVKGVCRGEEWCGGGLARLMKQLSKDITHHLWLLMFRKWDFKRLHLFKYLIS
jgi:hypothetical protein